MASARRRSSTIPSSNHTRPLPSSASALAPELPSFTSPPPPRPLRRRSRVRFDDENDSPDVNAPMAPEPILQPAGFVPQWSFPTYGNANEDNHPVPQSHYAQPIDPVEARRRSDDSDATLANNDVVDSSDDPYKRYSFSSYQHPYDIPAPPYAYSSTNGPARMRPSVGFIDDIEEEAHDGDDEQAEDDDVPAGCDNRDRPDRRRGVLSNLMDLYGIDESKGLPITRHHRVYNQESDDGMSRSNSEASNNGDQKGGQEMKRSGSNLSTGSEILEPDDPRVTGIKKDCLDDPEDARRNALRQMTYKQRRKEQQKIRIEFNVTSIMNRHYFLLRLARALMTFGAPSHRIESQLVACARILEVDAEFIHLPNVIICSFGDEDTNTSETHFIKSGGRLSLGSLHKVHIIYRSVVHDEISAKKATKLLDDLLNARPLYPIWFRCVLGFFLSTLICPLSFGGSFVDMWVAGGGALVLCFLQLTVATKSAMYANVFEITTAIAMSFVARGLGSIKSQIFCYTAISSAGIVGILPGYLILTSSLELASKNIVCGSVKMVYALIYTLFLGFGLQIGSDLFLLFDPSARRQLDVLSEALQTTITLVGTFVSDNSTTNSTIPPVTGTFTFTNSTNELNKYIVEGCYRPPTFPWYLQPFPWWTQFLIVPIFSVLSSLANLQPWRSRQLPVMVVISCASYATNKIANHYIFNRSDVVSAIGAFTVGLLGNIYSRKMGGTAFTSMVTGVLFLVPSGLSQAGGITANGSGVDIGGAMIAVTIGITVGLFMSQALVYTFGSRKNAAVFSF